MAEHKIDGNDGAGNAIAMARDNARDAALVEAAAVAIARKGNGEATLDHPYDKGYLAACDSCAAAILAIRDKPAPGVCGWQPIETAPENVQILVCQTKNGIISIARGKNEHSNWRTGISPMDYIAGVTHWMPLPAPPEA